MGTHGGGQIKHLLLSNAWRTSAASMGQYIRLCMDPRTRRRGERKEGLHDAFMDAACVIDLMRGEDGQPFTNCELCRNRLREMVPVEFREDRVLERWKGWLRTLQLNRHSSGIPLLELESMADFFCSVAELDGSRPLCHLGTSESERPPQAHSGAFEI